MYNVSRNVIFSFPESFGLFWVYVTSKFVEKRRCNWSGILGRIKFTRYNNGLLQWLLPDFPTENPLLNGMFCYICNGLVLAQRHWEQAAER